jgi:hypothetical protein
MSETPAGKESAPRKNQKRTDAGKSKHRRSHIRPSYSSYHHSLFKSIAAGTPNKTGSKFGIKKKAMTIIDSVFYDIMDRYSRAIYEMMARHHNKVITQNDMEAATKLIFNGELLKHALNHGVKSVARYRELNPGLAEK